MKVPFKNHHQKGSPNVHHMSINYIKHTFKDTALNILTMQPHTKLVAPLLCPNTSHYIWIPVFQLV